MPESHGADVRPSPYVSRLAGIEPKGVTALALAALALFDAINAGKLVATDHDTRALIEALYPLQDALHGPEGQLPQALAGFLSTAGGAKAEHMTDTDRPSLGTACANDAPAFTFKCGGELYRVVEVLDEDESRALAGAGLSIAGDMQDRAEGEAFHG